MEPNQPQPKPKPKVKIIDSLWAFLVATACLGPLALPLLWRNPRYSVRTKIIGSVAVLLFTWFLIKFAADFLNNLLEKLQEQAGTGIV